MLLRQLRAAPESSTAVPVQTCPAVSVCIHVCIHELCCQVINAALPDPCLLVSMTCWQLYASAEPCKPQQQPHPHLSGKHLFR